MYNLLKRLKPTTTKALSTTAAVILDHDNNRGRAVVQNLDAAITVYVGSGDITASGGGVKLLPGATWEYIGRGKLWAVAASGTPSVGLTVETTMANPVSRFVQESKTATDAPSQVAARNNRRHRVTVQNLHASESVRVGTALTPSSGGVVIAPNAFAVFHGVDAVWAVCDGTNEVQTITVNGAPTGGTFDVSYGGQTATVAYSATAAALKSALETLSSIGAGNVDVSKASNVYTVTFKGALANANVAAMTVDSTGLTGGTSPTVAVATGTQGASGTAALSVVSELLR